MQGYVDVINQIQGAVLRWVRGARASRFTCCPPPQIQKLVDHSDVISEVPKCSISRNFPGLTALPQTLGDGKGARQEIQPRSQPLGPRFYGSYGLTQYRVGNPTNDRFQM